jgi:hypothetical protein
MAALAPSNRFAKSGAFARRPWGRRLGICGPFPNPLRKHRPGNGLVRRLTARQREQVFVWLAKKNLTYLETLARIKKEFGITATPHVIYDFWRQFCEPRLIQRRDPADENPVVLEIVIQLRSRNPISASIRPPKKREDK